MQIETKQEMIDICILAHLKRNDSYSYDILSSIASIITLSEINLYAILRRLEAKKLLTVYSQEYNKRLRRYYKITSEGSEIVDTFNNKWRGIATICNFINMEKPGNDKKRRR
ncbi:MAG: helix-turn-helix transcriptional regulator [Oscillospiraceae bacterium]|nr:helix-turn-helix transcriptional regulator [Oscillospiraceae bacterium]